MTIKEFVRLVGLGARVIESDTNSPVVQWALVALGDGRQILFLEQTYREGSTVIVDPSDEELAGCRADPWTAWNSPKRDDEAILKLGIAPLRV